MAQYAKIVGVTVTDVVEAAGPFGDYTILIAPPAGIGYTWDGFAYTAPVPAAYNPVGADLVEAKAVLVSQLSAKADAVQLAIMGTTMPGKQRALVTNQSLVAKYDATTATAFETAVMTAQATALGLSIAEWATQVKDLAAQQAAAFGQIQAELDIATAAIDVAADYATALAAHDAAYDVLDTGYMSYVEIPFATAAWDTDGGLVLVTTPSDGWVFNAPADVSYDAQDPATPSFGFYVQNAKPSQYGDARVLGTIDPISALVPAQIRIYKISGGTDGYIAIATWPGAAVGSLTVMKLSGGAPSVLGTVAIPAVADVSGVWIKITDAGAGSSRIRAYTRDSGVWTIHGDYTDATPVVVGLFPGVVFDSDNAVPVLDAQTYKLIKFEATADGSLV